MARETTHTLAVDLNKRALLLMHLSIYRLLCTPANSAHPRMVSAVVRCPQPKLGKWVAGNNHTERRMCTCHACMCEEIILWIEVYVMGSPSKLFRFKSMADLGQSQNSDSYMEKPFKELLNACFSFDVTMHCEYYNIVVQPIQEV